MKMDCEQVRSTFGDEISELVNIQREEGREAIFFMYEDGSTSGIIKGEATYVRIPKDRQREIYNSGNVLGSIHVHPAGFDPSTIDLMTAVRTNQDLMGVAVPITYADGSKDYTLSVVDISELGSIRRHLLFRRMRRSSFGVTELGRDVRKQLNMELSGAEGCRTHKVVKDGFDIPTINRPSLVSVEIGEELGVVGDEDMFLD